jgi:hypothetical protein
LESQSGFLGSSSGSQIRINWFLSYLLETNEHQFSIHLSKDRSDFGLFQIACWLGIDSWLRPLLAREQEEEARNLLLNHAGQENISLLTYAITGKRRNVVSELLSLDATVTCDAFVQAIIWPCDQESGLLESLIEHGNVNTTGSIGDTPLMNTVAHRNMEAVRLLLQAGANVNARDGQYNLSALDYAAMVPMEFVQEVLRYGAHDGTIMVAAYKACEISSCRAHDDKVLYLLNAIHQRDPSLIRTSAGSRILTACAEHSHLRSAQFFVHHGVDVNAAPNKAGLMTAVYHAIASGYIDIVLGLVDSISGLLNDFISAFSADRVIRSRAEACQNDPKELAKQDPGAVGHMKRAMGDSNQELREAMEQATSSVTHNNTVSFAGERNKGVQVGQNYGTQTNHFGT